MSETLLVPLDGSELSEAALPWASCLARARNLSLVLVRVITWPPASSAAESYARLLVSAQETMDSYVERVRERLVGQGLPVHTMIGEGDPVESILGLADELDVSAIVMASRGRGGLARAVLGSVAQRVVQRASMPVLLVTAPATQRQASPALTRLLIPLDGSPVAEQALVWARVGAGQRATLVLLWVVTPVERAVARGGRVVMVPNRAETRRAVAEAEEYLRQQARAIDGPRFSIETRVRVGAAANEILAAATEHTPDLIAMGTRARTGPERWLMGSVADEVARRSERPVLLMSARVLADQRPAAATPPGSPARAADESRGRELGVRGGG